jgi:hypothetical protein
MIKETVSITDACALLNELLKLDPDCVYALVMNRIPCNEALLNHPTVMVQQYKSSSAVGLLGILNGLFGVREDGFGAICVEMDDENKQIICFKLTPERVLKCL